MDKEIIQERTALVIIDLQKGIIAMPAQPHSSEEVIANAVKLTNTFRSKEMPVFFVHVTPSKDRKDRLAPITDQEPASSSVMSDPHFSDFVEELSVTSDDHVITKRQWGAFYGTELDLQLRRRGIDTIVLCGISTNVGVESTARTAFELGYNQIFVEDATAARSAELHEHSFKNTFTRIGRIRSTQQVLDALS